MMNETKGITIVLSDDIKQELERRRHPPLSEPTDKDDWDQVLIQPKPATVEDNDEIPSNDQSTQPIVETESVVSDSPPYCLPIILVNLEGVTGYNAQLLTEQEQGELQSQLQASIHQTFEASVADLFESGTAQHNTDCDTSYDHARWISISYPEQLHHNYCTARLWKRLLKPHNVPVVDKLLQLLRSCNRPLLWKHDMRRSILDVVDTETARVHVREFTVARPESLEQLYKIREMFQKQLEMAKAYESTLLEERELSVQRQIRHGLSNYDLNSKLFSFSDQVNEEGLPLMLGFRDEDDEEEFRGPSLLEEEYSDHYSEEELIDSENEAGKVTVEHDETEDPVVRQSSTERRRAKLRTRHQKLVEAEKEEEHKEKLERARIEEERVREACTTLQLRIAIAKVQALTKKLEQVDTMLENIQEQEWAEEEENSSEEEGNNSQEDRLEGGATLLDQILATILHSQPRANDISFEAHQANLANTHFEIRKEWKEHFGRLPQALSLKQPVPTKADLGIVDCEKDNWEDDDSQDNGKNIFSVQL